MKETVNRDVPGDGFSQAMEKAARRLASAANAGATKCVSSDVPRRTLDTAKTSSMDVESLNNLVVQMRKGVRMAKVLTIRKLTHTIKKLRAKKGSSEQVAKNAAKADRLVEEIFVMKAASDDRVSKFALSNTLSLQDVHKQKQPSAHLRALVRLAEHKNLQDHVRRWRSEHTDWEELGAFLLAKNTGRRFRKKKLKATPMSKELNKTLLKETIKKATKDVDASVESNLDASVESDVDAPVDSDLDTPANSDGDTLIDPDLDASVDDAAADSEDVDHASPPIPAADQDASDMDEGDSNPVDASDDSDSAATCDVTSDNEGRDGRVSYSVERVGLVPRQPKQQRRQQSENEPGDLRTEGAGTSEHRTCNKNAKKSSNADSSRTGTARSAEMVVARFDLSAADSTHGCIIVPVGTASSEMAGPLATDGVRVPVIATKKKSCFFIRDGVEDDGEDADGGDDTDAAGEEGSATASEDEDERDGFPGRQHHLVHRPDRPASSRSVFVASLHGRANGTQNHTGAAGRSFSTRGRGQAVRFSREGSSRGSGAPRARGRFSGQRGGSDRGKPSTAGRYAGSNRTLQHPSAATSHQKQAPRKVAEKLHPSWEASRKRKDLEKLAVQPFAGKKIKFDD